MDSMGYPVASNDEKKNVNDGNEVIGIGFERIAVGIRIGQKREEYVEDDDKEEGRSRQETSIDLL